MEEDALKESAPHIGWRVGERHEASKAGKPTNLIEVMGDRAVMLASPDN